MYQKALHRVRTDQRVLTPELLAYWLQQLAHSGALAPRIAQTTIQHLPLQRFVKIVIPTFPCKSFRP